MLNSFCRVAGIRGAGRLEAGGSQLKAAGVAAKLGRPVKPLCQPCSCVGTPRHRVLLALASAAIAIARHRTTVTALQPLTANTAWAVLTQSPTQSKWL